MLDAHILVKIHLILFSGTILLLILQNPSQGKKDAFVLIQAFTYKNVYYNQTAIIAVIGRCL
jgi:hypothetical protein